MSFALLVHAMRGATSASIAMDARGFATAQGRTWALPAPWTRVDVLAIVVAIGLGAVPVLASLAS
jgi:energy-coupling factor transport system permease protein